MTRYRFRIRFSKQGLQRFISHRDLVRTLERALRRAGVPLAMSQGFHPKAKLSFPLALALGIAGADEVMEIELAEPISRDDLLQRFQAQLPPGLTIKQIELLDEGASKAHVTRVIYQLPIPTELQPQVQQTIDRLLSQSEHWIERPGRDKPLDVLADLEAAELVDGNLRIVQRVTHTASVQPREILEALEIDDPQAASFSLTRAGVELIT